ncbi:MAG: polysaccharide pyruvyl transferase family protein [Propionibacteriaceae bacterium]|jgi:hypothetical protein|nr:polysaccharide pyruvyl transferase family protein [Propionibacteriaceae bacterium]
MRILLRAPKPPQKALAPEPSLAWAPGGVFGTNTGNLLFSEAVYRALATKDNKLWVDANDLQRPNPPELAEVINENFDAVVLPLANAFRQSFIRQLQLLTQLIGRLTIPVVVVGVGCQASHNWSPKDLVEQRGELVGEVKAFVKEVLKRSAVLGTRGEFTTDYLAELGFKDDVVRTIGCPSLHMFGPAPAIDVTAQPLEPDSPIMFNASIAITGAGAFIELMTEQWPNSAYVAQRVEELALLLWGEPMAVRDERVPHDPTHRLYRDDRMRLFLDPAPWIDFARSRQFSVGSRIHGTVAALLAGTPAFIYPADSRTRELAEYHRIPNRPVASLAEANDIREAYESLDYSAFNAFRAEAFDTYTKFLEDNGLSHIWQDGQANPAYAERLAGVDFPPAVVPLRADPTTMERLRWLRLEPSVEQARAEKLYRPNLRKMLRAKLEQKAAAERRAQAAAKAAAQPKGWRRGLRAAKRLVGAAKRRS